MNFELDDAVTALRSKHLRRRMAGRVRRLTGGDRRCVVGKVDHADEATGNGARHPPTPAR
ncbi:MAG: hypothetical protein CMN72_07310 [Sphingomonas sp.]|nr:hypothetical protein [Sphingomonas sp.]